MSARPAFLGLALLASVLAAAIVLELDTAIAPAGNETGTVPIRQKPKVELRAAAQDPNDHTGEWLTTALARPMFSRDRRPTDADPNSGPTLGSLPRLTGIVIGPFGQSAIFAATDGHRPTVVTVGRTLGEYTVEKIEPGAVTVSGPQGVHHLALTADATVRRALTAEPPHPSPPQPQAQAQAPGQPPSGVAQGPRAALENLQRNVQVQSGPPNSQLPRP
ncbi:MAG: hypothetical protein FWD12_15115 [Alphaproteobacteria bacterium]|nr:hypothetical protein [Alphaproteobacteria bacterium]